MAPFHFPDEIWAVITDLKRHKPVRKALDEILSKVVITWTEALHEPRHGGFATFRNGRFSYERNLWPTTTTVRNIFYATESPAGRTYFPYSDDTSVFYAIGIGLIVEQ